MLNKKNKSRVMPVNPPSAKLFCMLKLTSPNANMAAPSSIKIIFLNLRPFILTNLL
jgi:hypothetical protein